MAARMLLIRGLKTFYFITPLWRLFLPVMKFDMSIAQLNFITSTLGATKSDGAVVEIGVGGGSTSVVINEFMKQQAIRRPFYAIDTFFGFTKEDAEYERNVRGKTNDYSGYRSNSKNWYFKTLRAHGIGNANVFQLDAKAFDYSAIAPIAFCLLDVDLYKPVEAVLPRLYENLADDGVIIVDDCGLKESIYDGAGEAYRNFCTKMNLEQELVHEKLGVVRKRLR